MKNIINKLNVNNCFFIVLLCFVSFQICYFITVQKSYGAIGFTTEDSYEVSGKNLAFHYTYSLGEYPNLELKTDRPFLHSLFIGIVYKIFGLNYSLLLVMNNLFLLGTILIIFFTGKLFHRLTGLIAATLIMFDPVLLIRANTSEAEMSFMFLLALAIMFMVLYFKRNLIIYGFLFALCFVLATFARTVTLYFPLLIPVIFIVIHYYCKEPLSKYWKFIVIFFITFLIPAELWMWRNYQIKGNWEFAGMKSTHLYTFMGAKAFADAKGITRIEAVAIMNEKFLKNDEYKSLSEGEKYNYRINIGKKMLLKYWPQAISHYIKGFPYLFFTTCSDEIIIPFLSAETLNNIEKMKKEVYKNKTIQDGITYKLKEIGASFHSGYWYMLVVKIIVLTFLLLLLALTIMGLISMILQNNHNDQKIGIFLFMLFSYLVLITCTWGNARLRTQFTPIMGLSSAYFIYNICTIKRQQIYLYLNKMLNKRMGKND